MTELERVLQQWRQEDARPAPHQGEHQVRLWALEQAIALAQIAARLDRELTTLRVWGQYTPDNALALGVEAIRLRRVLESKPP